MSEILDMASIKAKELKGKTIKTSAGNLKIKSAKYSGVVTNEDHNTFEKIVDVVCECGTKFEASIGDIQSVIITDKGSEE